MHWTKNDWVERRAPLPTQWNTAAVDEQKKGSSTTWTKWETISNTVLVRWPCSRLAPLAHHPASFRECILCFWSMWFHEPVAPFTCISSWIVNIYIFLFVPSLAMASPWKRMEQNRKQQQQHHHHRRGYCWFSPNALHLHYTFAADICKTEKDRCCASQSTLHSLRKFRCDWLLGL